MGEDPLGEEQAMRRLDRGGNAPLTRGPDFDRIARHLDAPRVPAKPRCPVCQKTGYRRIIRMADALVFWCRSGHPHYPTPPHMDN